MTVPRTPPFSQPRAAIDVSHLPTTVFGSRSVMWWGTLGFIVVEGLTLAISAAVYLYLRKNVDVWPPAGTPNPELLVPTLSLVVLLASIWPQKWTDRAAKRVDLPSLRKAQLTATAFGAALLVLRALEFQSLNVRWDSNAYGSVVWVILGFHTSLLLIDITETALMTLLLHVGPVEKKHFADVTDAAFYWDFVSLVWIPLYALIYLGPLIL